MIDPITMATQVHGAKTAKPMSHILIYCCEKTVTYACSRNSAAN